jgi:ABC-2 type transport system permease protein
MQAFPLIMNFSVMPLFFLSEALYPLDGLRNTLIGMTHFGLPLDLGVLAGVAVVFMGLGAYSFSKIQL